MGILQRVTRNFLALTASLILERGVSFVLFLIIARRLGADALGEYALALSFLAIFETVSVFGQNLLVVREVVRDRDNAGRYLVNSSALVLIAAVLCGIIMPASARVLGYPAQTVFYVGLAALILIPDSLSAVPEAVLQAWERMEFITLFRFVTNLLGAGLAIGLLLTGAGLAVVFYTLLAQRILLTILYAVVVRQRLPGPLSWRPDLDFFRRLAQLSWTFLGMSVFSAVFKNVDMLILRGLADAAEVGYYSAADRPVQVAGLLGPIVMTAIFPSLTATFRGDPERFAQLLETTLRGLAAFTPLIAMLFTLAAPAFVGVAYGAGYTAAVLPFQVLAWSLPPTFLAALLFRVLLASNHERVSLRVAFVNMIASVILNLLLIPRWGAVGASVTTIFTALLGLAQNYVYVQYRVVQLRASRALLRPALSIGAAAVLFIVLPDSWHIYLRGSVATLGYLVCIPALGVLSRSEMARIWAVVRGRPGPPVLPKTGEIRKAIRDPGSTQ
jgi:O-antigen/teichoic acid export membrane protein